MKRRSHALGARGATLAMLILLLASCVWQDGARAAGQPRGASAFAAGMAAAHAGRYAVAAHDFEQALLQGHTDPNTFYQLGLAYSKLKDWNDATWALAMAAGDDVFSATTPAVVAALTAASKAGGVDSGPPPLLRNVNMTPMNLTPAQQASIEARSAITALQGNGTYFVAPIFNNKSTALETAVLTAAAADLQNNSTTAVKFVFLSATPAPYTSLAAYTKELFAHLRLSRAVLVAITPQAASAYSDRVSSDAAQQIATAQRRSGGTSDPLGLAAAIARAVTQRADDDDAATTRRTVLLVVAGAIVLGSVLALTIWRVARRDAGVRRGRTVRRATLSARSRVR